MPINPQRQRGTWPTTQITLLQRVADRRDARAWDCFVRTYGPLIHGYCLRRGLQEADACDITQDVLMRVNEAIGGFRYDKRRGRFRGWLGTVTYHALLKHLARARRSGSAVGNLAAGDPSPVPVAPESLGAEWVEAFNAHVYREAVRRLRLDFSDETWRAFHATFAEGRPPQDVADELERTVGWVYQAKSQVVRRLKAEILYLAEDSILLNACPAG